MSDWAAMRSLTNARRDEKPSQSTESSTKYLNDGGGKHKSLWDLVFSECPLGKFCLTIRDIFLIQSRTYFNVLSFTTFNQWIYFSTYKIFYCSIQRSLLNFNQMKLLSTWNIRKICSARRNILRPILATYDRTFENGGPQDDATHEVIRKVDTMPSLKSSLSF